MTMKTMKSILALSATALLSACASAFNGPNDNPTVSERHPIAVDTQTVTLTLAIDPATDSLSGIDQARLRAFANAYLRNGHGPVTVTAPSGAKNDLIAQEMAADVRQYLHDAGVSYAAMTGASYRNNSAPGERELVLSYTHYVATPSACGIWKDEVRNRRKNISHPNFGCADQNNLAALVADPRDLVTPADEAPADATSRVRTIDAFRGGELTASERDAQIETSVSN
ncbi:MAG: CpaD family pilus assembly protein [Pseudomonadota bacterium]